MSRGTTRDDAGSAPAKRARLEELVVGVRVTYATGKRGVIRENFGEIDEFWIEDSETRELERDDEGSVVPFKAEQLRLVREDGSSSHTSVPMIVPPAQASRVAQGPSARVLLIANETHMVQMLEHFEYASDRRKEPQVLLAIPVANCRCGPDCKRFDPSSVEMCSPASCPVTQIAADGVHEDLEEFARRLRPDLEMRVRVFHLKQALEQIGPELTSLGGYFCLSALTLPYGIEDIRNQTDDAERDYQENIGCQIDLGVSANGSCEESDASPEEGARRVLREYCGIDIASPLWAEEGQLKLRKDLKADLPLKFWDGNAKVFVMVLPEDAVTFTRKDGVLCYEAVAGAGSQAAMAKPKAEPAAASRVAAGKCVGDWKLSQDEFKHLGKLPKPWIFLRSSRDKDVIYYMNTQTQQSTGERPLAAGWAKHTSKSTGKTYYFHAQKNRSMFEIPPLGPNE